MHAEIISLPNGIHTVTGFCRCHIQKSFFCAKTINHGFENIKNIFLLQKYFYIFAIGIDKAEKIYYYYFISDRVII